MSAASGDFASMTPKQLRQEADRREMIERHRILTERRAARVELAEEIVALPAGLVHRAQAFDLLKNALLLLVKADSDETWMTHGDVNMLSFEEGRGRNDTWWPEATAPHASVDHESVLDKLAKQRVTLWPAPKNPPVSDRVPVEEEDQ